MLKISKLRTAVLFATCLVLLARAEDKQGESVYKLMPSYEIAVNDNIIDVIYDTVEITANEANKLGIKGLGAKVVTDTIKVEYTKLIVIGDKDTKSKEYGKSILFFDKKGRVTGKIALKSYNHKYLFSPNKKLIAVRSGSPAWDELTLYNQEGYIFGKFKIEPLNFVIIADDGSFVVYGDRVGMLTGTAKIGFHDLNGALIIEKEISYWTHVARYSPDNKFVILVSEKTNDKIQPATMLVCFDKKGKEIWQYVLEDMNPRFFLNAYCTSLYDLMEFSDDSRMLYVRGLVYTNEKKTWVFNIDGQLIEEKEGWQK